MARDTGPGAPGESPRDQVGSWDPWPMDLRPRARSWRPPAPQPGIIPLRPVEVGEILRGAFAAVRRNPGATLGISAVVTFCYGVCVTLLAPHSIPSSAGFGVVFTTGSPQPPGLHLRLAGHGPAVVAVSLLFGGLYLLLGGMLTAVIDRLILGVRMSAGQAVRAAWPKLPAMVGTILLPGLPLAGLWSGYALAGLGLRRLPSHGPLVFFLVVPGIPLLAVTIWLMVSYAVALQAVALEHASPLTALRRSYQLVRGSWWRVFGIGLLTVTIMSLVSGVLKVPFQVIAVTLTQNPAHAPVAAVIISTVGRVVADTVTTGVAVGVLVLLYVDLRMRKEGLDRTLQAAAADPSGAR